MTASSRRRYHRATPPGRIPVVHAFRRSSVVERAAVNRLVVGSSPTAGATFPEDRHYATSEQPDGVICVYARA